MLTHAFGILILFLIGVSPLFGQSIVRGPFLQQLSENSVIILWRTDSATTSSVDYGHAQDQLLMNESNSALTTEHSITLNNLNPDTQYFYKVTDIGSSVFDFITAVEIGARVPVRIWALGDSGTSGTRPLGTKDARQLAVYNAYLSYTASHPADILIMLGDNAYSQGTDSQYQNALFDFYPNEIARMSLWATQGNHDHSTIHSPAMYTIFDFPTNAEVGGTASGTEWYYSFDQANIHFIVLNSFLEYASDDFKNQMLEWLRRDITATEQDWVIGVWHHPPYTKGGHDSDTEGDIIWSRENFLPILDSGGVDLVITGHSHSYERSYLLQGHYGDSTTLTSDMILDAGDGKIDSDGAYVKSSFEKIGNEGVVYVAAGSSGKLSSGTFDHPAMPTSHLELGSLLIDVNVNRLHVQFLNSNEVIRDNFTIIKNPNIPPPPNNLNSSMTPCLISLTWDTIPGATHYLVYRSTNDYSVGSLHATVNTNSLDDYFITPSQSYYYHVRAGNSSGNGGYSEQHMLTALPGAPNLCDLDEDSVPNVLDNCQRDANSNQSDTDKDNIGDVCDACTDTDGDGYGDPSFSASTCTTDLCPNDSEKFVAEVCGCGVTDVDLNSNGVIDCLYNREALHLLQRMRRVRRRIASFYKSKPAFQQHSKHLRAKKNRFRSLRDELFEYTTNNANKITLLNSDKSLERLRQRTRWVSNRFLKTPYERFKRWNKKLKAILRGFSIEVRNGT